MRYSFSAAEPTGDIHMKCQIGLYTEIDAAIDQWVSLIDLQSNHSAKDLLEVLIPFLKDFHSEHGMDDAPTLAAWLPWHLIEVGKETFDDLSAISINRQINPRIDFFVKLSPGLVEVFRIDELLEWHPLAQVEVVCEPVEIAAYEVKPDAASGER
ncbi:MAG: hypothetical protein ACI906_000309 [Candidatus Latescibacterota bacterium]